MTTLSHLRLAALMAQQSIGDPPHRSLPSPGQVAEDCQRLVKWANDWHEAREPTNEDAEWILGRFNEILAPYGLSAIVSAEGITVEGVTI